MASDISVKLNVDGERDFKTALKSINTELKETDSALKLAEQGMDSMGTAEESAAQKSELLAQKLEQQKEKVDLLQKQYDQAKQKQEALAQEWQEAANANGENSKEAQKAAEAYEKQSAKAASLGTQLNNAKYEMNETARAMEKGADAAEDLENAEDGTGKATFSLQDAFGKISDTIQSKTGVNVKGLAEKFSSLTGVSAAYAAGAAAVVAVLYKIAEATAECIDQAAEYADTMATLSKTAEVDIKTLEAWKYAEDLLDVSLETQTGALKKVTKAIGEAAEGSSSYVDAFKKLGVSVKDANGELRDSESVYYDVIDALGQVSNAAERDNLAQTILGKSYNELNPLIEAGSDALKAYADEAQAAGYILSDDVTQALNDCADAQARFEKSTEGFKNQWGGLWANIKTDVLETLTPFVTLANQSTIKLQEFKEKLGSFGETAGEFVGVIARIKSPIVALAGDFKRLSSAAEWLTGKMNEGTLSQVDGWDAAEGAADAYDDEADAIDDVSGATEEYADHIDRLVAAQDDAQASTRNANAAMMDIQKSCDDASGSGEELTKQYEELVEQYNDLDGAGTQWQKDLTQEKLEALKAKAAYQTFLDTMKDLNDTLHDELPAAANNMCVSIEAVAATLYGSGTTASEWAGWYNDAFNEVASGFDTLEVNTENSMQAWVDAMNQRAGVEAAWTENRRFILDNIGMLGEESESALRSAVDLMNSGGVEEYGQVASDLQAAMAEYMATGDAGALSEIQSLVSAINLAGDTALHEAAAQFMAQEQLTESELQAMIDAGSVILENGQYTWSAASQGMGDGVAEGIEAAGTTAESATTTLVSTAADAILSGDTEMAWTNGGKALGEYLKSGISEKAETISTTATTMLNTIASNLRSKAQQSGIEIGRYFDIGFANGIRSNQSLVYNAAYDTAYRAAAAARNAVEIGSPSKLMYRYGRWFDEGFINGMKSMQNQVASTAAMVTSAAAASSYNSVSNNTTNSNSYSITINAASGQDENAIANAVMAKINQNILRQRGARA